MKVWCVMGDARAAQRLDPAMHVPGGSPRLTIPGADDATAGQWLIWEAAGSSPTQLTLLCVDIPQTWGQS